jgi:hypothetical protein
MQAKPHRNALRNLQLAAVAVALASALTTKATSQNFRSAPKISGSANLPDPLSLEPALKIGQRWLVVSRREVDAVDVFGSDGIFVARLPGKLDGIKGVPRVAIASVGDSTLIMLDRRTRLLASYILRRSAPPLLISVRPVIRNYVDMCALGGRLFMYSPEGGGAIDAMFLGSGKIRHSWVVVGVRRPRVEEELNEARIVCSSDRSKVFVASTLLGNVKAFDLSGNLVWSAQIRGFKTVATKGEKGRSFGLVSPVGGYHSLFKAVMFKPSRLLLQYATLDNAVVRRWGELAPILSVVLDGGDGHELARTSNLPFGVVGDGESLYAFDRSTERLTPQPFSLGLRSGNAR